MCFALQIKQGILELTSENLKFDSVLKPNILYSKTKSLLPFTNYAFQNKTINCLIT